MTKKAMIWIVLVTMLPALLGCTGSGTTTSRPQLTPEFPGREITYSFSAQPSEALSLSSERAKAVLDVLSGIQPEYAYADYYCLEEVKSRLDFATSVEQHQYCALDSDGKLDPKYLAALVQSNNKAFLQEHTFGYTEVEGDYILSLCRFIVEVVIQMRSKYPNMDWDRVYCNLGNLKILYNVGMLSYAQVSSDLVLSISKNNTEIVLKLKGEDGFSRVLTHETMHILQIGCSCENIENAGRRAGIAMYWDDFTLNTGDWTWLVEGSAERNMCNLTGGDALTYQYKMDYLCSMTMSVLLRETVAADTMETLCFYSDPELLFDAFDAQTETQRDELLNMMITLQVLQMQPKSFYLTYQEKTGINLQEDEERLNQFSYSLKPAPCTTLAKEFYENLVLFLQENELPCNDLFFLLTLFEGHINQHLSYSSESKAQINRPFMEEYRKMRDALFVALEADNPGLDLAKLYEAYEITGQEDTVLNAELGMLDAQKRDFLAERAQWQAQLRGLGIKVPPEQLASES